MEEFPEKADNSFKGQQVPVTTNEMKKFLGLKFLTGIVRKLNLKMYWLTEQLLSTPVFFKIMKRDRFLLILKFLYFNNNDDPGFNPNYENRDWLKSDLCWTYLVNNSERSVNFEKKCG